MPRTKLDRFPGLRAGEARPDLEIHRQGARDDMGTIITIIGTATVAGWFMRLLARLEGER